MDPDKNTRVIVFFNTNRQKQLPGFLIAFNKPEFWDVVIKITLEIESESNMGVLSSLL